MSLEELQAERDRTARVTADLLSRGNVTLARKYAERSEEYAVKIRALRAVAA